MDAGWAVAAAKMPLAEAVWLCWRQAAEPARLEALFAEQGGGCYTGFLTFADIIRLTGDALFKHGGSGRRACAAARTAGTIDVSDQAFYGKLRRLPPAVSMAFLAEGADRLRALLPEAKPDLPAGLSQYGVYILDGKTIKGVQRRLKVLRRETAGPLGGRALVALCLNDGLVVAMHAHPDGDANEVRFLPEVLAEVRRRRPGPRLFVQDRAFCDPQQAARCCEDGDQFLARYNAKTSFHPDESRSIRTSMDAEGRWITQTWGWLGRADHPQRGYVRRIELARKDDEPLTVITSLLDPQAVPAEDLLELYRRRWGIERVFQQVTEVFGLQHLIGSSPAATIFQFAYCLVMYDVIQVIKACVAAAQNRPAETVSTEKLFDDAKTHLGAWTLFFSAADTVEYLAGLTTPPKAARSTPSAIRRRLTAVLANVWTDVWIKSPPQPHRRPPPKRRKPLKPGKTQTHVSVHKLLMKSKKRNDSHA